MPANRRTPSSSELPHRFPAGALAVLAALCVAPVLAVLRLRAEVDLTIVAAVGAGLSLMTFGVYGLDKRRAQSGAWRVPEWLLHACSALGGWPGAFLGQRVFRHKTVKVGFQLVFWLTVLAYEFVAIDYLLGWPILGRLK